MPDLVLPRRKGQLFKIPGSGFCMSRFCDLSYSQSCPLSCGRLDNVAHQQLFLPSMPLPLGTPFTQHIPRGIAGWGHLILAQTPYETLSVKQIRVGDKI